VALGVFQGFSLWLLIPLLFHFCATFISSNTAIALSRVAFSGCLILR
jgi:hypothetical protein